jgi:hypothetical protein
MIFIPSSSLFLFGSLRFSLQFFCQFMLALSVVIALLVTFRGLAMAGISKPKLSTKIQISTEVQNVN